MRTTNRHLLRIISIHAPAKGATQPKKVKFLLLQFQSTLPRRERLCTDRIVHIGLIISIHAPAKGATIYSLLHNQPLLISIHAPAKGATCLRVSLLTAPNISIHAPAKGATWSGNQGISEHDYFNPRSREGSD